MALNDLRQGGEPAPEERDHRLAQLYRAGSVEEPPAHLDAAIFAAARREVGAKPKRLGASLRAWRVPVSIAAVIVLSVSLVTLMMEEGADRVTGIPPVVPPAAQPPTPPPAAVKPESRGLIGGQRPAEAAKAPAKLAPELAQRAAAPPAGPVVSQEAPAAVPAPGRTAEPFPGAGKERREAGDVPRRSAPPEAKPDAASAPRADHEGVPAAPTRALSAPPAPAKAPAEAARARSEAGALRTERQAAAGLQKSALLRELDREPAEKWLERIEDLRRQGEAAMAEEVLAEFKRRFPNHALPPGMR